MKSKEIYKINTNVYGKNPYFKTTNFTQQEIEFTQSDSFNTKNK